MDRAYALKAEETLKFVNLTEWTGFGGRPVETALLRYRSNGKMAPRQSNRFELRLTLTRDQRSSKTG